MAIEKAIKMYQIRNLKLGTDGRGMFLSLVCPAAEGYCLCFTQGAPVTREELDLTENELFDLLQGKVIQRPRYRLQGVRANVFHATPNFRNFKAVPPEQIQVWSLSHKHITNETILHFPENAESQIAFIPMRYSCTVRRTGGFVYLKVDLLDNGNYENGVLLYQVGNTLPIPIPGDKLGKEIRLYIPSNEDIKIIVSEDYRGKYIRA